MINISLDNYLKRIDLYETYCGLSETEKKKSNLYNLFLYKNPNLLFNMVNFFFIDKYVFNQETFEFDIYNGEDVIGHLNNQNFDVFREHMQCIMGTKKPEDKELKFKNILAKNMYNKFKNHKCKEKNTDDNLELENMIRKYCTHNKNGINIFNVWDLTYYQFNCMFAEYCIARKYDFNDLMAANSFSYSKSSEYKSMDFLKKLNT